MHNFKFLTLTNFSCKQRHRIFIVKALYKCIIIIIIIIIIISMETVCSAHAWSQQC